VNHPLRPKTVSKGYNYNRGFEDARKETRENEHEHGHCVALSALVKMFGYDLR
jgi:hypothetical protein